MIVSHKYRFIFIKTLKTAGTSVEVFLSSLCDDSDIVTPIYPPEELHRPRNHAGFWNPMHDFAENEGRWIRKTINDLRCRRKYYNHIPAKLLRHRLPKAIWDSYFKFCIERNPWDKTLSHFHMMRARENPDMAFDQYLARRQFCYNYPIYTDNESNVLVDRIISYESLNEGLTEVFERLGIPYDGFLDVNAKAGHRKDRRPYQEVFDEEARSIIEVAFRKEIELHGYTFQ